jgi:hypothetical protein
MNGTQRSRPIRSPTDKLKMKMFGTFLIILFPSMIVIVATFPKTPVHKREKEFE